MDRKHSELTGSPGTAARTAAPGFLSEYQDLCAARALRLLALRRMRREIEELQRQIDDAEGIALELEMQIDHLRAQHPSLGNASQPLSILRRQAQ